MHEMDRRKTPERVRAYRDKQKKQTVSAPLLKRASATAYTTAKDKARAGAKQRAQYPTIRALKWAITKCRNSPPSSPREACEVVAILATSTGMPTQFPKLHAPVMISALNQSVNDCYLRDDISLPTPGNVIIFYHKKKWRKEAGPEKGACWWFWENHILSSLTKMNQQ